MNPFKFITKKWIAGNKPEDAIRVAQNLHAYNMGAIINFLGEHERDVRVVWKTRDEYLKLIVAIAKSDFYRSLSRLTYGRPRIAISVKPSQLGTDVKFIMRGEKRPLTMAWDKLLYENLLKITFRAACENIFVWVDMENFSYNENTVRMVHKVHEKLDNIGMALQANLRKTFSDFYNCLTEGIPVRLCKGAYPENPQAAFTEKAEVDANYRKMVDFVLAGKETAKLVAFATHDEKIIRHIMESGKTIREFQMLYGICPELQLKVARKGYPLSIYVPYGKNVYKYVWRRLKNPYNRRLIFKNVLGLGKK